MNKYFVNHREVTYRAYLQSTEADKLQFPCNDGMHFYYDPTGKLIKVNDEWV